LVFTKMPIYADQESEVQVAGTPLAYKLRKSPRRIKGQTFAVSSTDSQKFATEGLFSDYLRTKRENVDLRVENTALKEKVAVMQHNSAEKIMQLREIPREQAKAEIRKFFQDHHGESVYPSDILESLHLDYDLVYEICEELEKEGKIKGL
jgi:hypothetical protein